MAWDKIYLSQLVVIINLIKKGNIENGHGALKKFDEYLDDVKYLGQFSSDNWDKYWRKKVYDFAKLFDDVAERHAGRFLRVLNEKLKVIGDSEKEVIEFIKSELVYHYETKQSNLLKQFADFVHQYPDNPEFAQNYSNVLFENNYFAAAIQEAEKTLLIEPDNKVFLESILNKERGYFEYLLDQNDIKAAKKLLQKMEKNERYIKRPNFASQLVVMRDRFRDIDMIFKKIDGIDAIVRKSNDREKWRYIEIFGIFSAIIAFVVVNVDIAIAEKLAFAERLLLMVAMGAILSIFAITISYIFNQDDGKFFLKPKFWVLIILLVFVGVMIAFSQFSNFAEFYSFFFDSTRNINLTAKL
ncbi:hypothetical protein KKD70_03460 [Patescibacteria group bacterium]|nr:hypothetical protein [Patescibacteria group bacterium]